MNKIFLIADTHFGHTNIIAYENRPFNNIETMDKTLMQNWNNTVSKNDSIIVAGDFSFYNKEKTADILSQLNGRKLLIKGNHDSHSNQWYRETGFDDVSSYPVIINEWFIIQHEPPAYYNDSIPYFYIYGHVHSTEMYPTVTKQSACVSVERWNYTPVALDKIIETAKRKQKENES